MMTNHRSLAVTMSLVGMVGSVVLVGGCGEVGRDAYSKASLVERGATEADLTQAAGPPTERLTTLDDWCEQAGGSHELLYTVRGRYLGGWLPDLRMSAVAFCIDDSSKIVDMAFIDWH